jgi:hypothetical protein
LPVTLRIALGYILRLGIHVRFDQQVILPLTLKR